MSLLARRLVTRSGLLSRSFASSKSTNFFHILDDAEYTKFMDSHKSQDKLVVVDWFATWCGPCVKIAPVFTKLSEEHSDVVFAKVDVDECNASAADAGIEAMPTFSFYRHGKKIQEMRGADPVKLASTIASLKKV